QPALSADHEPDQDQACPIGAGDKSVPPACSCIGISYHLASVIDVIGGTPASTQRSKIDHFFAMNVQNVWIFLCGGRENKARSDTQDCRQHQALDFRAIVNFYFHDFFSGK